METRSLARDRRARLRMIRHYVEMLAAMGVGMAVLGPLESFALGPLGWPELRQAPELMTLSMVANMTIGMVAWMRFRGHRWAPTLEMVAAMDLPFLVLLPLLAAGQVSLGAVMVAGHVLMLVTMALPMVRRLDEYDQPHQHHRRQHRHRPAGTSITPVVAPTTSGSAGNV